MRSRIDARRRVSPDQTHLLSTQYLSALGHIGSGVCQHPGAIPSFSQVSISITMCAADVVGVTTTGPETQSSSKPKGRRTGSGLLDTLFFVVHPISVFIFFENTFETLHSMMSCFSMRWSLHPLSVPSCLDASQAAYVGVPPHLRGCRSMVASPSIFLPSLAPATWTLSALLPCHQCWQILRGNLFAQLISPASSLPFPSWALRFRSGGTAAPTWATTSPPS